ncbi:MAG: RIO1 family regulatory kinase/ATPase [Patescibacteria group bacterium]
MIDLKAILKDYENKNYILQNPKPIRQGKEATVFVVWFQGEPLALKVYIDPKIRAFQNNLAYTEGQFYRKPSERRAVAKRNKFAKALLHKGWVRREFYLLDKLLSLGATVPEVYDWTPESILMEFVGKDDVAPRLIDVELNKSQVSLAFESVLKDVERMLECGVVHGDLSAYNILWWQNKPWIIDFPQAIDIRYNPRKDEFLKRDLDNVISYFGEYLDINSEQIYQRFLKV